MGALKAAAWKSAALVLGCMALAGCAQSDAYKDGANYGKHYGLIVSYKQCVPAVEASERAYCSEQLESVARTGGPDSYAAIQCRDGLDDSTYGYKGQPGGSSDWLAGCASSLAEDAKTWLDVMKSKGWYVTPSPTP